MVFDQGFSSQNIKTFHLHKDQNTVKTLTAKQNVVKWSNVHIYLHIILQIWFFNTHSIPITGNSDLLHKDICKQHPQKSAEWLITHIFFNQLNTNETKQCYVKQNNMQKHTHTHIHIHTHTHTHTHTLHTHRLLKDLKLNYLS